MFLKLFKIDAVLITCQHDYFIDIVLGSYFGWYATKTNVLLW